MGFHNKIHTQRNLRRDIKCFELFDLKATVGNFIGINSLLLFSLSELKKVNPEMKSNALDYEF